MSPWFPRLLILIGCLLRVYPCLSHRSLWLDEAYLALNILRRDYGGLLATLDYNQAAPIGFLFLTKGVTGLLGMNEFALRLVPLIFGCLSLPLFFALARRHLPYRFALVALFLYAFSDQVILYANEFKQYSSDAAIAIGLLYLTQRLHEGKISRLSAGLFLSAASLGILLSHPAALVLGGLGLAKLLSELKSGHPKGASAWAGLYALTGALFVGLYLSVYRANTDNDFLIRYWIHGFVPFPPLSFADLQWYAVSAFELFRYPLGFYFQGLAAFLFLVGLIGCYRRDRETFLAFACVFALVLLASMLKKFPLEGRVALFLAPFGVLVISRGLAYLASLLPATPKWPLGILLGLLALHPLYFSLENILWPRQVEEFRPVLSDLSLARRPGEPIYLFSGAAPSFHFYASEYGLNRGESVEGSDDEHHWQDYDAVIGKLRQSDKAWFLFGHFTFDKTAVAYFRHRLDQIGERAETFEATGVTAFAYRFPAPK